MKELVDQFGPDWKNKLLKDQAELQALKDILGGGDIQG